MKVVLKGIIMFSSHMLAEYLEVYASALLKTKACFVKTLSDCRILYSGQQMWVICEVQGAVSVRKTVLPSVAIPMLKIRRPNGRLIFNMEIAIRK